MYANNLHSAILVEIFDGLVEDSGARGETGIKKAPNGEKIVRTQRLNGCASGIMDRGVPDRCIDIPYSVVCWRSQACVLPSDEHRRYGSRNELAPLSRRQTEVRKKTGCRQRKLGCTVAAHKDHGRPKRRTFDRRHPDWIRNWRSDGV